MSKKLVTAAIVGAGHRAVAYASYALQHPDRLRITAIADPNEVRRRREGDRFSIPESMRFQSFEELAARPGLADAVINGTMDRLHYSSSLPLLEAGYHLLLEKPIASTEAEVRGLIDAAQRHKRIVMICHVLRYAPFYRRIKDLLDRGTIGSIIALTSTESINYHHMTTPFVRGRWRQHSTNPILLSKCCHDLDIIAWLMSGVPVRRVASFGSLTQFRPENAPPGSAMRCLDGCQIEATCIHSARTNYITQGLWGSYVWESIEHIENPTIEQKLESLRSNNPYGRCVWHCDNDVADHQTVIIEFANGATATHNLFGGGARIARSIHITGTLGEIQGDLETDAIEVLKPRVTSGADHTRETINVAVDRAGEMLGHGGGDAGLIEDFVAILAGHPPSRSVTHIEDSLTGHLIAFAADTAMLEGRVVSLNADE